MGAIIDFLKNKKVVSLILVFILLILIVSAVFFGEFSTFGNYRLHHILQTPLRYGEPFYSLSDKTGLSTQYSLTEIVYYSEKKEYKINYFDYEAFYNENKNLPGLMHVTKKESSLFKEPKATLKIYATEIRLDQKELFQVVEIAEDFFRVQIIKPRFFPFYSTDWIYYKKPGIYDLAQNLFVTGNK